MRIGLWQTSWLSLATKKKTTWPKNLVDMRANGSLSLSPNRKLLAAELMPTRPKSTRNETATQILRCSEFRRLGSIMFIPYELQVQTGPLFQWVRMPAFQRLECG